MTPPNLPTVEQLQPEIEKLVANPDSCVIVCISWPRHAQNFANVNWSWFSQSDTASFRKAVERARKKRKQLEESSSSNCNTVTVEGEEKIPQRDPEAKIPQGESSPIGEVRPIGPKPEGEA